MVMPQQLTADLRQPLFSFVALLRLGLIKLRSKCSISSGRTRRNHSAANCRRLSLSSATPPLYILWFGSPASPRLTSAVH
jgi:hypothetical protein